MASTITTDTNNEGLRGYTDSGANPWYISDMQRKFITDDRVRHVLVSAVSTHSALA